MRDPNRKIPIGDNLIVSPCDGSVFQILKWKNTSAKVPKRFFGHVNVLCRDVAPECHIIMIFMSPFDVHVNRVPFDGKVLKVTHSAGAFHYARSMVSLENEKNEVLLSTSFGKMKFVQVAGFLARRIVCYLKPKDKVIKGQRFGFINVGSELIVVLPKKIEVIAKVGQTLRAGESVIART